jgi:predicted O-methyltransferase YrrM
VQIIGEVLRTALQTGIVYDAGGRRVRLNSNVPRASIERLQQLVMESKPSASLEVGCAMGISTMAILYALDEVDGGQHTAIDPYQRSTQLDGWSGIGLEMVRRTRLGKRFLLREKPSYLALPELVTEAKKFGFIFIDGWHSFDYTFVDYFYADLLLSEGGILVFDDAALPQVYQVCHFLETHKDYERIGGVSSSHPMSPFTKVTARLKLDRGGRSWGSIQAYKKVSSTVVPWNFYHSNFYPYYLTQRAINARHQIKTVRPSKCDPEHSARSSPQSSVKVLQR